MIEMNRFTIETSKQLAKDIITFCKKWGMWQDVAIYTGGKCYTDASDDHCYEGISGVIVREELHPEECTKGVIYGVDGECEWKSFSNPEHILDMTFDGTLYQLLRHREYDVKAENLSEDARKYISMHDEEVEDDVFLEAMDYLENREGWDPMEFDSYEEYLEVTGYCEPYYDKNIFNNNEKDFATREEYLDFLERAEISKVASLVEWFSDNSSVWESRDTYFDNGKIAGYIISEFSEILKKYGLWYELGFPWSLTAYLK
ncbi:MAG: hypothetical protein ACI4D8_02185 [Wujia sp.]